VSDNPAKFILFRVMAVLLSLTAVFAVIEILLRVWGPPYYKYSNRSAEYFTNPRGYHVPLRKEGKHTVYGLKTYHNESGYRLPDNIPDIIDNTEASEVPGGRENIIMVLGDSFTYGRGVRYSDIYTVRLEQMLNMNGYPSEIKNAGISGSDLPAIVNTYFQEVDESSYDLIIYGFVLNDFGLPGMERIKGFEYIDYNNPENPYDPLRKKIRTYNLIKHLIEKKRLHDSTRQVYIDAFTGDNAENNFASLKQFDSVISQNGGELVILLFPLIYDLRNYPFREIHNKIKVFCENNDILLLDLLPVYSAYEDEDLWVNPTDHHPNEIAHEITAEALYSFLTEQGLVKEEGRTPSRGGGISIEQK
jgi:hypothetical protein